MRWWRFLLLACIVTSVIRIGSSATIRALSPVDDTVGSRHTLANSQDEDDYSGEAHEELRYPMGSDGFWICVGVSLVLVCFAGLMSGLTLGLLSLDLMHLEILLRSGTPLEKKYAELILPLVKRHHLLLVTLLLCNAISMEALPIFLDKIVDEYIAVLVSVTLVLLFGEIIPQAVCARYGLAIGARLSFFVKILMVVSYPITGPIAKLLDKILGHSHQRYFHRAQLRELLSLHGTQRGEGLDREEPLLPDEVTIMQGALEMHKKKVVDIVTPIKDVFMLDVNSTYNTGALQKIVQSGHSRIPLYSGSSENLMGVILTKSLLGIDPRQDLPVSALHVRPLPRMSPETRIAKALDFFQTGQCHMAVVADDMVDGDHPQVYGVVTLEDILEEVLQEEIFDESDNRRIDGMPRMSRTTAATKVASMDGIRVDNRSVMNYRPAGARYVVVDTRQSGRSGEEHVSLLAPEDGQRS